jgi:hypothetical protein
MLPLLLGLGGAAIGALSTYLGKEKEKEGLERQQKQARQQYEYQRQYQDNLYNLQRGEAQKQGAIQTNRLAQSLGADTKALNMSLEEQALQAQDAQIAQASSVGEARAAAAMSGARGSAALDKQIAYQQNRFARQQSIQNRAATLGVESMARQYSNQFNDIGRELESWNEGGYRAQAKSLQDTYSQQVYQLQQQGYEDAINDVYGNWLDTTLDFSLGALSGFSTGSTLGFSLEKMFPQNGILPEAEGEGKTG